MKKIVVHFTEFERSRPVRLKLSADDINTSRLEVRKAIKLLGLPYREIAKELGVSYRTVQNYVSPNSERIITVENAIKLHLLTKPISNDIDLNRIRPDIDFKRVILTDETIELLESKGLYHHLQGVINV